MFSNKGLDQEGEISRMLNIRRFRSIGRVALTVAVAITPALAMDVSYSTTDTFNCTGPGSGCTGGTNVLTGPNGLTITYTGITSATVTPPYPTNAQFGSFTAGSDSGPGDPISATLTIAIDQTVPSVTTATLSGQIAGTISTTSSNILLNFTHGSGTTPPPTLSSDPISGAPAFTFILGGVSYWIDQRTAIDPASTGGGVITINGAIENGAIGNMTTPEPSFFALTGAGFAGMLALAIRRRIQGRLSGDRPT